MIRSYLVCFICLPLIGMQSDGAMQESTEAPKSLRKPSVLPVIPEETKSEDKQPKQDYIVHELRGSLKRTHSERNLGIDEHYSCSYKGY